MAHTFITSTELADLRPLAWQGVQASSCYDQLVRLLQTRLGPKQAALLAEPIVDAQQGKVDWYSSAEGNIQRLLDLAPEQQNAVRAELASLGEAIYEIAQNLKNTPDSNSTMAGALLEMSISFPSEEYLYLVGNQPVISAWGYAPGNLSASPENLTRVKLLPLAASVFPQASETPENENNQNAEETTNQNTALPNNQQTAAAFAAPTSGVNEVNEQPAETQVVRHVFPFPWAILAFVLSVLLCAFLLFWLLPRLGVLDFGPAGCSRTQPIVNATAEGAKPQETKPHTPGMEEYFRAQGREQALRNELERLRREYELRLLGCGQRAEAPPPLEPTPEPPQEVVPPVPDLVIPKPEPKPEPKPKPKPKPEPKPEPKPQPKPQAEGDGLVIPQDPSDLSFLEGCWDAQTGLKSTRTNMPISVKYCFDGNGNGTVSIIERDRNRRALQECRGQAKARLNGATLQIDDLGAKCPGGVTYEKERIRCRNADGSQALCTGVGNPSGETNWQDKPFTRTSR